MFQKKVLCLGNNSQDTDLQTSELANQNNTVNHGLIDSHDFVPEQHGYYHTTVVDLPVGAINRMADYFDLIILLDQPYREWSNYKLLLTSFKLIRDLAKKGLEVQYEHNINVRPFLFSDQFLKDNKSFCIHPWINFTEENRGLKLCPRDRGPVLSMESLRDWKNSPWHREIRQNMLAGNRILNRCGDCYEYEDRGIESYRQYETQEWLAKLDIKNFEDLDAITHPYFYELRLSNKCNIQCRSCNPLYSHLIDKEAKIHNIIYPVRDSIEYSTIDRIDINTLSPESRVYLTGGEPTVMDDAYEFMRRCIKLGRTDFELTFGTNGVKFSNTFLKLCSNFSNLNFSFSLDGYGKINDYWRWGSDWESIVKNMHAVEQQGHRISVNTVPGIYNVTNLHLLYEFLDREFPHVGVYLQLNHFESQSAFNHPDHDMVLDSLRKCQQTNVYLAYDKSNTTGIDSLVEHYSKRPACNLDLLKKFFEFNDQLDRARNSRLADYIPELEHCRKLLLS